MCEVLKRIGEYDLCGKTLGRGAFAKVELADHRLTNQKVALKVVNLEKINDNYMRKNILRESSILKDLDHDNIVRLYEVISHRQTYCFVTEYLDGGDLLAYVRSKGHLQEKQTRKLFAQLVSAVNYLHSKDVMHRDLTMQNVMLLDDKKTIKLVDFGLSNFYSKEKLIQTQCGSAEYAAPELFVKGAVYGPGIDIWSMGVILYAMTTGTLPFMASKNETLRSRIMKSLADDANLSRLSPALQKLLRQMLEVNASKRISIQCVMESNWLNERRPSQPHNNVNEQTRQKIIEQVAKIYQEPIEVTMKHLASTRLDSMNATFHILLDSATKQSQANHRRISLPNVLHPMGRRISLPNVINARNAPSPRKSSITNALQAPYKQLTKAFQHRLHATQSTLFS